MTLTLYVFDFHEVWVPHLPRAYSILKDSTNINSGKFSWSYFYFILHLSVSSIIILQFLRVQQLQYVLTLNNPSKKNLFHSYSHFPVFFLTGDVFFLFSFMCWGTFFFLLCNFLSPAVLSFPLRFLTEFPLYRVLFLGCCLIPRYYFCSFIALLLCPHFLELP